MIDNNIILSPPIFTCLICEFQFIARENTHRLYTPPIYQIISRDCVMKGFNISICQIFICSLVCVCLCIGKSISKRISFNVMTDFLFLFEIQTTMKWEMKIRKLYFYRVRWRDFGNKIATVKSISIWIMELFYMFVASLNGVCAI